MTLDDVVRYEIAASGWADRCAWGWLQAIGPLVVCSEWPTIGRKSWSVIADEAGDFLYPTKGKTMSTATACRLRPLGDRAVVKPDDDRSQSTGGILLPDTVRDKEPVRTGRVLRVGPGFRKLNDPTAREPVEAKEGDHVIFGRFSGTEVEVDGEKLLLMSEREIFAVVG